MSTYQIVPRGVGFEVITTFDRFSCQVITGFALKLVP